MKKGALIIGAFVLAALAFLNQTFSLNNQLPEVSGEQIPKEKTAAKQQIPVQPEQQQETEASAEIPAEKPAELEPADPVEVQPAESAGSYADYDNTKHGWGFTRNSSHLPPAVGWVGPVVEKYSGIYTVHTDEKVVYLTFDEGYENGFTADILNTLKDNNVKAHFFITSGYLKSNPELVKRIVNEGHVLGNHSVNHPSLPTLSDEQVIQEIKGLESQVKELVNYDMYLFRPPMGEWSERTLKITEDLGYKTVFWSMAYQDWQVDQQQGWERAYNHVITNVHNGAVILLHAVSSDNAGALDKIIKDLQAQGYRFELL